jgi:sirohydrochlorin ferrochelatase
VANDEGCGAPAGDEVATTATQVAVVVVVGAHGSRNELANQAHRDLVEVLAERTPVPVAPAFLELATPSIPDAIDQAVLGGAGRVRLLPYFLHPGRHSVEDLPRIVDEARTRHPGTDIDLLDPFGADPRLLGVLAHQIEDAL